MEPLQVCPIGPPREGVTVLALSGELDYNTEPTLAAAAGDAMKAGCRQLVLECAGLTFCDSQGLNRFLRLRLAAQRRGVDLVLAAISTPLRHLLELTEAVEVFQLADTVDQACTTLAPADQVGPAL
ncbi:MULTISPECIES: STAS domain-containing protein [Streptomyces]|uniref:STAS domain-containing protein n=1 Tax=Streptomyces TaxID=1883 RepID=UPI0011068288|nr:MULTISPECIES: STAS domain-containing protein [Streptomyces]MCZ4102567.1 STAS domain-containing protein [Streptomyces sp. H39-C1]